LGKVLYTVIVDSVQDLLCCCQAHLGRRRVMNKIRDGDLYKIISLFGKEFEIKYGYYEEYERTRGEPIPIYPDFERYPEHTEEGYPFVTQMQELCEHGESEISDAYCADCKYYKHGEDLIGICTCEKNKNKIY